MTPEMSLAICAASVTVVTILYAYTLGFRAARDINDEIEKRRNYK